MAQPLYVKVLHPDAKIPTRAKEHDAGFDFYLLEDVVIPAHSMVRCSTGVAVQLSEDEVGLIKPRSSAFAAGLDSDGTIDSGYCGEVKAQLRNTTNAVMMLKKGERHIQMVVVKFQGKPVEVVKEFPRQTDRLNNGFGSSGK